MFREAGNEREVRRKIEIIAPKKIKMPHEVEIYFVYRHGYGSSICSHFPHL